MTFVFQNGYSPLLVAVLASKLSTTKILMEAGANVNQMDKVSWYKDWYMCYAV